MKSVRIRGEGVAASCCAHLLHRAGLAVARELGGRPRVPAVMLGETAQKLLGDVFERTDLFDGATRVRRRIVAWGANAAPLTLAHSSVVVSEDALLDRIHAGLDAPEAATEMAAADSDWTIFAARPLPEGVALHHFGSRLARASTVRLTAPDSGDACFTESLDAGWLFLLPGGDGRGWMLSVGGPVDALLAQSSLIAGQVAGVEPVGEEFPCHPRIADPLSAPGWLICGTAAVGFDPLCGDGVGYATREAILASAVVRAAAEGSDADTLASYYRTGVVATFHKHLLACQEFYRKGRRGAWWEQQLAEIERGLSWCAERLREIERIPYRLQGFELQRIA